MSTALLAALGIASAVVNTIGLIPYLKDIFKHKTKPERATWWIWVALNAVAFTAQVGAGATWSLLLTAGELLSIGVIAYLSLNYGYGRLQQRDIISLLVAMLGLILWKFTNDPIFAIAIVVLIDLLGFWLTVTKTWKAPHTETLISWICAGFAGTFGTLAVGKLNFTQLLYPLYIMLANWLLVWVIVYRRKALA
jgi:hypothetical protein